MELSGLYGCCKAINTHSVELLYEAHWDDDEDVCNNNADWRKDREITAKSFSNTLQIYQSHICYTTVMSKCEWWPNFVVIWLFIAALFTRT